MPLIPIGTLLNEIRKLHTRLDQVVAVHPKSVEEERAQYVLLLKAVTDFFAPQRGRDDVVGRAFFDLALALDELNDGVVSRLTKPTTVKTKKQGGWRSRDPSGVWYDRATVAAAFTLLTTGAGMSQSEAARHIAKHHKWTSELVGSRAKGEISGAIKNWEFKLRNGLSPVRMADDAYHQALAVVDEMRASGRLRDDQLRDGVDAILRARGTARRTISK
jgi:hypothetical protein